MTGKRIMEDPEKQSTSSSPVGSGWELYAVSALFLAGLILRFFHLGHESVWLDEVLSYEFARSSIVEIVRRTAADVHPPLYYLILHPFLSLGIREEILRLPSFLFGSLAIPLVYLIGRELYGKPQGLIAALLLAFSPFHIFYSQEARMYPLFFFWVCLSTYLLILALRGGQWKFWIGYALATAFSLYTHYFTVFILLAQNLYVLIYWIRKDFQKGFLLRWLASQGIILLVFAPWLPVLLAQYRSGKGEWMIRYFGYPGVRNILETIRVFGTGPALPGTWLEAFSLLFLALALLGLFFRGQVSPFHPGLFLGLSLFLPLFVVFLASLFKPAYQVKYLIGLYPFYLFLVSGGIFFFRRKWMKIILAGLLLLSFAYPLYLHYSLVRGTTWREANRLVALNYQDGDVVGFNAGYISRIFQYYIDLNFRGRYMELYRFPYFKSGESDLPKLKAEMEQLHYKYKRIWLLQAHSWDSDPYGIVVGYLAENYSMVAKSRGDPELYLFRLK
ncbi:MAG: glycosyltransferase family 39 protein [Proteobacteria bacterium]|nr:glycosyltransferase family 39 protein [Pseudomonadota bacterium]